MALTTAQLTTLKNDILAKGAPGGPLQAWRHKTKVMQ